MVDSLLYAVDPRLEHPSQIKRKPRPDTTRVPWMDIDTFVDILRSGFEEMKREEDELLMGMGNTSLLSGVEELEKVGDDMALD